MSRDEADRALAALGAAYDRISAAMYRLDTHPGLAVVGGGGLSGRTARAGAEVLARTGVLWSHFAALGGALDRARSVRRERSRPGEEELRSLTLLLGEAVVRVGGDGLALDESSPGPVADRLPLTEVARRLETGGGEVIDLLDRVEAARAGLAARFGPLQETLARVGREADALAADALPADAVRRLRSRLDDAQAAALADPLTLTGADAGTGSTAGAGTGSMAEAGAATGEWDGRLRDLAAEIDRLAARVGELAAVQRGYPERSARLRVSLDELAGAEAAAGRAFAVALAKIANTGLPAVPDATPALRAHLLQLDQLYRERRWARLSDELSAAERGAAEALDRAGLLREAADGLLRRRAELRGRLDAYRAKAARLGLAEHTELSALHRTARDLLYTSPCDLPAATRAVLAFQRGLADLTERTPSARREPSA